MDRFENFKPILKAHKVTNLDEIFNIWATDPVFSPTRTRNHVFQCARTLKSFHNMVLKDFIRCKVSKTTSALHGSKVPLPPYFWLIPTQPALTDQRRDSIVCQGV